MFWEDPLVEDVRRARDAYAKQFDYDLDAIYNDLKDKERRGGRVVVRFPAREPALAEAEDN